jgi:hypothetical protein
MNGFARIQGNRMGVKLRLHYMVGHILAEAYDFFLLRALEAGDDVQATASLSSSMPYFIANLHARRLNDTIVTRKWSFAYLSPPHQLHLLRIKQGYPMVRTQIYRVLGS